MFGWFKKKGPTLEERFDALAKSVETVVAEKQHLEHENNQLAQENQHLKREVELFRQQDAKDKAKYESKEPWIAITSESFDETKGIAIGLDWNDAFIQYLKDNGIKGSSDEDVVRKYIAYLYQDLLEKLETRVEQQATSKGKITDYE